MNKSRLHVDKSTEKAVHEILKSRAESRIYIFLLRKKGAVSEEIIQGTKLHPSTVRELLSKMHDQKIISRQKLKNESIGKNPYVYKAASPLKLLQKYAKDMEDRLNKLANLADKKEGISKYVRIKIYERVEKL
jgi:predicted transcriptional regulator